MDKKDLVIKEIIDFHQNIENWFRGETEDKEALYAALMQNFHADFKMQGGSGNALDRATLSAWLPTVFAQFPNKEVAVSEINIFLTNRHALAEYLETQKLGDEITVRKSSAVFLLNDNSTVCWYHLLEQWLK